jgi:hypothetical protein
MSTLTVTNTRAVCDTPHSNYESRTNSSPQGIPQLMPWKSKAENGHPNHSGYLLKSSSSATPVVRTLGNVSPQQPPPSQRHPYHLASVRVKRTRSSIIYHKPLLRRLLSWQVLYWTQVIVSSITRVIPSPQVCFMRNQSRNELILTDIRRCAKGIEKNNQNDFSWLCQGA